jgi:chitinase
MWKLLLGLLQLLAVVNSQNVNSAAPKVVCYYNSTSFLREGLGKVTVADLEPALPFCTHLVYGWARINFDINKVESSNPTVDLDSGKGNYRLITTLKRRFPQLKILLSIGGQSYDKERTQQFHGLLENSGARLSFINSAYELVKSYDFDGIDLAWEFPPVKPKKKRSGIGSFWHGIKKVVGAAGNPVDEKSDEHREAFTALIRDIKNAFKLDNYILATTVLPNVNYTYYYDVPMIINNLDFVSLSTFDYSTPERNPKEADYAANLYPLSEAEERNSDRSIDGDIGWWLANRAPASKLVVGIPAFGRAWELDKDSGLTGVPPVAADGRADPGPQTQQKGLFSWPEVCAKLPNASNANKKGADAALRKVGDPTKRYGSYAYRLADDDGEWVSYEEPATAQIKAQYVKAKGLGGIGIFNLDLDDFRGACQGEKYPILRAAKQPL